MALNVFDVSNGNKKDVVVASRARVDHQGVFLYQYIVSHKWVIFRSTWRAKTRGHHNGQSGDAMSRLSAR